MPALRRWLIGSFALAALALALSANVAEAARVKSVRAAAPTCSCCQPKLIYVLEVCHPCTGCIEHIEVCLPACCVGAPCVDHRCTLIGCGATTFTWDCGEQVVVRFKRNGSYTVRYR